MFTNTQVPLEHLAGSISQAHTTRDTYCNVALGPFDVYTGNDLSFGAITQNRISHVIFVDEEINIHEVIQGIGLYGDDREVVDTQPCEGMKYRCSDDGLMDQLARICKNIRGPLVRCNSILLFYDWSSTGEHAYLITSRVFAIAAAWQMYRSRTRSESGLYLRYGTGNPQNDVTMYLSTLNDDLLRLGQFLRTAGNCNCGINMCRTLPRSLTKVLRMNLKQWRKLEAI